MASRKKESSILLLKAEHLAIHNSNACDKYAAEFKARNLPFDVVTVSEIDFRHKHELSEKLKHPEKYSGIIFTSARPVKAVALARDKILHPEWKVLPSFALGKCTAQISQIALGLDCQGSHSECGYQLTKFISKKSKKLNGKPLLLPHGNLKTDSVLEHLKDKGLPVECIEVYNVKPHRDLEKNILDVLKRKKVNIIIFFSPTGINFTIPIFKANIDLVRSIKFVAIGKITEATLLSHGFTLFGSSMRQTPDNLADQLKKILS